MGKFLRPPISTTHFVRRAPKTLAPARIDAMRGTTVLSVARNVLYSGNANSVVLGISIVSLAMGGCATMYEVEPGPGKEPASIEGSYWGSLRYDRALIKAIDEKEFGFRPVASASILPGHHAVTAHCFHGWSHLASAYGHDETLEFVAVPGRKYQVKCKYDNGISGTQWTWIEDRTTGEVVAGNRPD